MNGCSTSPLQSHYYDTKLFFGKIKRNLGCEPLPDTKAITSVSCDVTVIQWITECHNVMTTHYITLLAGTSNIMATHDNNAIFHWNKQTLRLLKSHFNGHMINRILCLWSFHIRLIKLAKASLINFIWNDHSCKILYIMQSWNILAMLQVQ